MNYLATLNDKQSVAVRHTEGYLRVIAEAGSEFSVEVFFTRDEALENKLQR